MKKKRKKKKIEGSIWNCNEGIYFNTIWNVSNHVFQEFDNCRYYDDIGLRINFHVTVGVIGKRI